MKIRTAMMMVLVASVLLHPVAGQEASEQGRWSVNVHIPPDHPFYDMKIWIENYQKTHDWIILRASPQSELEARMEHAQRRLVEAQHCVEHCPARMEDVLRLYSDEMDDIDMLSGHPDISPMALERARTMTQTHVQTMESIRATIMAHEGIPDDAKDFIYSRLDSAMTKSRHVDEILELEARIRPVQEQIPPTLDEVGLQFSDVVNWINVKATQQNLDAIYSTMDEYNISTMKIVFIDVADNGAILDTLYIERGKGISWDRDGEYADTNFYVSIDDCEIVRDAISDGVIDNTESLRLMKMYMFMYKEGAPAIMPNMGW